MNFFVTNNTSDKVNDDGDEQVVIYSADSNPTKLHTNDADEENVDRHIVRNFLCKITSVILLLLRITLNNAVSLANFVDDIL